MEPGELATQIDLEGLVAVWQKPNIKLELPIANAHREDSKQPSISNGKASEPVAVSSDQAPTARSRIPRPRRADANSAIRQRMIGKFGVAKND